MSFCCWLLSQIVALGELFWREFNDVAMHVQHWLLAGGASEAHKNSPFSPFKSCLHKYPCYKVKLQIFMLSAFSDSAVILISFAKQRPRTCYLQDTHTSHSNIASISIIYFTFINYSHCHSADRSEKVFCKLQVIWVTPSFGLPIVWQRELIGVWKVQRKPECFT